MYAIGSSTKAFVAAALCILCDDGKLTLDDPVKKHIPEFEMYDSYVTENLTVRDILCHRCGLAAPRVLLVPAHGVHHAGMNWCTGCAI